MWIKLSFCRIRNVFGECKSVCLTNVIRKKNKNFRVMNGTL